MDFFEAFQNRRRTELPVGSKIADNHFAYNGYTHYATSTTPIDGVMHRARLYYHNDGSAILHITEPIVGSYINIPKEHLEKFQRQLISEGGAISKKYEIPKHATPNLPGRKRFKSPVKYVLAQLDKKFEANQDALDLLVQRKQLLKVKGSSKLEKYAKTQDIPLSDELYAFPVHAPSMTNPYAIDPQNQRVITTAQDDFNFKGTGDRNSYAPHYAFTMGDTEYEVPFTLVGHNRDDIRGGLHLSEVKDTYETHRALLQSWQKIITDYPKIARDLEIQNAPPFVTPVAVFKPLQLIARTERGFARIPKKLVEQKEKGHKTFDQMRFLIIKNIHTNKRLSEINNLTPIENMTGAKAAQFVSLLMDKFNIPQTADHLNDVKKLIRKVQLRAIAMHVIVRTAGLSTDSNLNAIMHEKDFTFTGFQDTNSLSKARPNNKHSNLILLNSLGDRAAMALIGLTDRYHRIHSSDALRLIHELRISSHPHYHLAENTK